RIKRIGFDPRDPSRILLVGTADEVKNWAAYIRQIDVPESGTDGEGGGQPRTQVFHLNYLDDSNASLINGAISQLYPVGEQAPTPLIDPATRTMVVTTTPRYLSKIERLLAKLDVPPMQVNIEGKIVEVDQSAISQIGINWSAIASPNSPGAGSGGSGSSVAGALPPAGTGSLNAGVASAFAGNFTLGTVVNAFNISQITAQINALVEDQKAQIVTAPNITTIDNQSATLGLIQTQVYEQQTSTITNGVAVNTYTYPTSSLPLTLVVTPKISREDRRVLMNINFQLTSPNGQPLQTGAPVPTEQEEAITNVSVDSGDTYVIGGLVTQDNSQAVYRVPFLSDIPLLGLLFKYTSINKTKKDIIVFIKPTIVGN
ncbi:MAG: type II secretion system protein GspD, partial [bacterium]